MNIWFLIFHTNKLNNDGAEAHVSQRTIPEAKANKARRRCKV
jgi:hypothetical protein